MPDLSDWSKASYQLFRKEPPVHTGFPFRSGLPFLFTVLAFKGGINMIRAVCFGNDHPEENGSLKGNLTGGRRLRKYSVIQVRRNEFSTKVVKGRRKE